MMLSLLFMFLEDKMMFHGRQNLINKFKKFIMITIFGPLHMSMLAQVLMGGIKQTNIWHLYQIRLVFFCRPFAHLIFYICLIPVWGIIFNERGSEHLGDASLTATMMAIIMFTLLIVWSFALFIRSAVAKIDD